MVKSLQIDPAERQKPFELTADKLVGHQYSGNVKQELESGRFLTKETALRIFMDMYFCRVFEESLEKIKKLGMIESPNGELPPIQFDYGGPAHLGIGQEADAVGKAFLLKPDDVIFGSHRSHVEIIAKALSAIYQLSGEELNERVGNYHGGELLEKVKDLELELPHSVESLGIDAQKDLIINAILYGTAAEIFCASTGFNRGLGGSMHAFFLPFGIGPNNAIVGSSANIAAGAAYAELVKAYVANGKKKTGFHKVMFNIGDGAVGRGPFRETLNYMGMAQIRDLWEVGIEGLPLIAHIVDNCYAMGGQTKGETMSYDRMVRVFAGQRQDNYHAETINGNDPLAVIDFYYRKFNQLEESGAWPLGAHSETYRFSGHSPSDQGAYRERDELEAWKAATVEPLERYKIQLRQAFSELDIDSEIKQIEQYVEIRIFHAMLRASDPELSPPLTTREQGKTLEDFMFNTGRQIPEQPCELGRDIIQPLEHLSTYQRIKSTLDQEPSKIAFRDGIALAILQRGAKDRAVVMFGEENRDWGGAFAVYRDFEQFFPYHRLYNFPISEGTIVGAAVGAAMQGLRPIAELMYADFMGCAGEELINQLPKWQGMSAGQIRLPVCIRVSLGNKYAAQHSQNLLNIPFGVPGLYLAEPATPYDANTLLTTLLMQDNPFLYAEAQALYGLTTDNVRQKFGLDIPDVPLEETTVPIGVPDILKQANPSLAEAGRAITILAYGSALFTAAGAALEIENLGYTVELINGKWYVPFDYEPVLASVAKTGHLIIVSNAPQKGSTINTLGIDIQNLAFNDLDAPVAIVGARNTITPGYRNENDFFPQPSWILDEIHNRIFGLNGYTPATDRSPNTLIHNTAKGV